MHPAVQDKFNAYPEDVGAALLYLRALILQVASDLHLGNVTETLKWGEPSYSVKTGSPIRLDWKPKSPAHYCLYFNCQTKLVSTFRELYGDTLKFQGNRAIVFDVIAPLPEDAIKHCIELALTYQQVKNLPLLGA